MKQPKTYKNPRGAGKQLRCRCNEFGCLTCMNRFIYSYYRAKKVKKLVEARKVQEQARRELEKLGNRRYEWDRTGIEKDVEIT